MVMAPARPCTRFRYFKHFIQPLGGILPSHADDDAKGLRSSISSAAKRDQNRHGHPAQPQDALLYSSMLRKKIQVMKMVSLSSTQPVD